jgi:RNA polymerase sigma factor (sigma-70 family)
MELTDRNQLISENIDLARKVARYKKKSLFNIYLEDLEAAAFLGLVQAAESFQPEKCKDFQVFAVRRIIGAVQEYLRELSWGTRNNCWNREDSYELLKLEDEPQRQHDFEIFETIISCLPDRWKIVVRKYYLHSESLKMIAEYLGITEGRVSHLLSQAKMKMQVFWKKDNIQLWESVA